MGEEAPEFLQDFPKELSSNGYGLINPEGYQADFNLGDKIYVVGGSLGGDTPSTNIKFFDKSTSLWMVPTVLGIEPTLSEGHSAVLVNNDRILILKRNKLLYDSVWFLEVDTPYVREQKKVLGTEVVAWSKGVISDYASLPVVITGPSGVGKGTLISKLMNEFPTTFGFSVSHTTRAPREKEMDGVHYHFADRSLMEKNIRDGKFLESASVHGNLYGTSIEAVEAVTDIGKRCILDIDVQGARSVRASSLDAIFIFICPPSFDELEKRLRARGTEIEEQIQKRLKNAKSELDQSRSPGLFDHLLVNDDLESCYQNLKKLLALDEGTNAVDRPNLKNFNVSLCHTVSKSDKKVVIHSGSNEGGATHPTLIALDVSSLKGGAPGRTRALKISAIRDS